jgi:hypothetical protein
MDRGTKAAVPAAVPADCSEGKKYISREGDNAVLHEKRYSPHLLKVNHMTGNPGTSLKWRLKREQPILCIPH